MLIIHLVYAQSACVVGKSANSFIILSAEFSKKICECFVSSVCILCVHVCRSAKSSIERPKIEREKNMDKSGIIAFYIIVSVVHLHVSIVAGESYSFHTYSKIVMVLPPPSPGGDHTYT